jgi:hypothetical protein
MINVAGLISQTAWYYFDIWAVNLTAYFYIVQRLRMHGDRCTSSFPIHLHGMLLN